MALGGWVEFLIGMVAYFSGGRDLYHDEVLIVVIHIRIEWHFASTDFKTI